MRMSNGDDALKLVKDRNAEVIRKAEASMGMTGCAGHAPLVELGVQSLRMGELNLERGGNSQAQSKSVKIGKLEFKGYSGSDVLKIIIGLGIAAMLAGDRIEKYREGHVDSRPRHSVAREQPSTNAENKP